MKKSIKNQFSEDGLLKVSLILMGVLIVWFNVMGYNILFKDEPIFWIITPIAILFFFAEMSVLLWSSSILRNWRKTKAILKGSMFIVVPIFGLLSFTGINSYLNNLATSDYVDATTTIKNNDKNLAYIEQRKPELNTLRKDLTRLQGQKSTLEANLQSYTNTSADFSIKISQRKAAEKRGQCDDFADCKEAVDGFIKMINEISALKVPLKHDIFKLRKEIDKISKKIDLIALDINKRNIILLDNAVSVSAVESEFENKKKIYEDIVIKVASWFGLTINDPFSVFVAFISGIIYPVYFLINLYIGLSNNDSLVEKEEIYQIKHQQRKDKISRKKSYYQLRSSILKKIYKLIYLRVQFSRRKYNIAQEQSKLQFTQKSEANIEAIRFNQEKFDPAQLMNMIEKAVKKGSGG